MNVKSVREGMKYYKMNMKKMLTGWARYTLTGRDGWRPNTKTSLKGFQNIQHWRKVFSMLSTR